MSSLEQQRRAGGAAMTASRGTGAGMAARRRGKATVDDINSLVKLPTTKPKLAPIEPRGGLAAKQGRGDYQEPEASTGGGIASPITEIKYSDRTYWDDITITSSDGLLSFRVKPIKQIEQVDANADEVVQIFANPKPPAPTP
jgi:hypothetical protein